MNPVEAAREYLRAKKEVREAEQRLSSCSNRLYGVFDRLGSDATIIVDDTAVHMSTKESLCGMITRNLVVTRIIQE